MKKSQPDSGFKSNGLSLNPRQRFLHALATDREFTLLIAAGFISGIAAGISTTILNNFLNDVYHLSETARGLVELPRELPGALMIFIFAVLSFIGSTRLAALSMIISGIGMLGLGMASPTFAVMLIWMVVLNLGTHIFMPLVPGIGMQLSQEHNYGIRLGKYNAYNLAATIIGYIIVYAGFEFLGLSYGTSFVIGALCYVAAGVLLYFMKPIYETNKRKLVFKKKYTLYYILSIVNGVRKQIFLTFAPWVLIKVFHVDAPLFAVFGFVIAFVSIGTRSVVGRAIDKLGERVVLSAEAILLIILCAGYAFSADLFGMTAALVITAICYIIDNSLNAVEMARSTYVKRIADDPADVLPTLSTGLSLDHVVSMTIPVFGGMIWAALGYQTVFMLASLVAVTNLILSFRIKIAKKPAALPAAEAETPVTLE